MARECQQGMVCTVGHQGVSSRRWRIVCAVGVQQILLHCGVDVPVSRRSRLLEGYATADSVGPVGRHQRFQFRRSPYSFTAYLFPGSSCSAQHIRGTYNLEYVMLSGLPQLSNVLANARGCLACKDVTPVTLVAVRVATAGV